VPRTRGGWCARWACRRASPARRRCTGGTRCARWPSGGAGARRSLSAPGTPSSRRAPNARAASGSGSAPRPCHAVAARRRRRGALRAAARALAGCRSAPSAAPAALCGSVRCDEGRARARALSAERSRAARRRVAQGRPGRRPRLRGPVCPGRSRSARRPRSQGELVAALAAAGEAELAEQLHAQAGRPGPPPAAEPGARAARAAADAAKYLQTALPPEAVRARLQPRREGPAPLCFGGGCRRLGLCGRRWRAGRARRRCRCGRGGRGRSAEHGR